MTAACRHCGEPIGPGPADKWWHVERFKNGRSRFFRQCRRPVYAEPIEADVVA